MWRFAAAGALVTLVGVAVLSMQTPSVHACSAGPDWDPVAESAVVVAGRLTGWEEVSDDVLPNFKPIRVHMNVDRVYKGPPGLTDISFVDSASLYFTASAPEDLMWAGSSGACGAFDSDPTGVYAVMGLWEAPDGELHAGRLHTFFFGEEPGGQDYERALERMASFPAAAALPALGTGPAQSASPNHLITAVAALGTALLLASLSIRYMSKKKP
ncbi:MAG: hypothetical protein IH865_08075 [Chloroflexi bacterium]|nr:hypothetical protein [Chloroflexota bacterium]